LIFKAFVQDVLFHKPFRELLLLQWSCISLFVF